MSITLVTNSKASALELISKPVQLSVIKVGGCEETISSKLYEVTIMEESGKRVHMRAYGIEKITNDISCTKLNRVIQLPKDTVDFRLFELAVIRSSRLFEAIFISLGKPPVIRTNHFSISLETPNKRESTYCITLVDIESGGGGGGGGG